MAEMDTTVAMNEENEVMEQPADDAQAAEITAEELIANLSGGETAENEGDGGPTEAQEGKKTSEKDKFEGRIKAALSNQARQYRPDVDFAQKMRGIAQGMTDEQIAEALRAHQARAMHESDPEISEKAAAEIIKAREAKAPENPNVQAYREGIKQLMEDGWTAEELRSFASDETVREELASGKSLRAAATAFLRRGAQGAGKEKTPEKKNGVPTVRRTATASPAVSDPIATMSDEEFEKFSKRVKEEALAGRKVRL